MHIITTIVSGSRAFGTANPDSDLDLKCVHIPAAEDILLQRVKGGERLRTMEDAESFALHRFIEMVTEGNPLAIEMLFSEPGDVFGNGDTSIWSELVSNRDRLLTSKTKFEIYAIGQAKAFKSKKARIDALHDLSETLRAAEEKYGGTWSVRNARSELSALGDRRTHIAIRDQFLEFEGLKIHLDSTIDATRQMFEPLIGEYGDRARAAAVNQVDWKSLMHALRIAEEGIEYYETGAITLPRPNAEELRAIRNGEVPAQEVEDRINKAIELLKASSVDSDLPDEADMVWIEQFVTKAYAKAVVEAFDYIVEQGLSEDVPELGRVASYADFMLSGDMGADEAEHFFSYNDVGRVRYFYTSSNCDDFATAMHEIAGWPVVAIADNAKGPVHRLVQHLNGKFVDASGWVTFEELCKRYALKEPYLITGTKAENWMPGTLYEDVDDNGIDDALTNVVTAIRHLPYAPFNEDWFQEMSSKPVDGVDRPIPDPGLTP